MSTPTTTTPSSTASPSASTTPITEAVFYGLMHEVTERLSNVEAANEILIGEVDSLNDRVTQLQERAAS